MNLWDSRCSGCPNTNRCVPGDGPVDAAVFCIGEAPGRTEDQVGRAFMGQAGHEFNNNYLMLAGLYRDEVYVTNARKCRPPMNRTPRYGEIRECGDHFVPHELALVNPTYVILMGASACRLLGPDGIDLEAEHGIPRWGGLYGWEGWIVPVNHPASGLHDGAMMGPMMDDWEKLGRWFDTGEWSWPEEPVGDRDYRLCETPRDVYRYFEDHISFGTLPWAGVDTETQDGVRWSMQASIEPGSGAMVLAEKDGGFHPEFVKVLSMWLGQYEWVLHNADADIWVEHVLNLLGHPYRDTMQEAYGFQTLPQGLKALSRRLLGRKRVGWKELVTPYSKEALHQWMIDGVLHAEANWRSSPVRVSEKTGKVLKSKLVVSEGEKLLREIDGYMVNNPDYPVWDKLIERVPTRTLEMLCGLFGPIPRKGIAHVPLDLAVEYGCSDADDALAVALLMKQLRVDFKAGLNVRPEDRDE